MNSTVIKKTYSAVHTLTIYKAHVYVMCSNMVNLLGNGLLCKVRNLICISYLENASARCLALGHRNIVEALVKDGLVVIDIVNSNQDCRRRGERRLSVIHSDDRQLRHWIRLTINVRLGRNQARPIVDLKPHGMRIRRF